VDIPPLPEEQVAEMIGKVVRYFTEERALYQRTSEPLAPVWKSSLQDYFPEPLLDAVRTVTLEGARIPPPPFYPQGLAMSGGRFPDFVHLASVTYVDIIVFNEAIARRTLFHGLVHAQQMAALGMEAYVGFYLRGFLKTRSWTSIPLEAQAFQLEARFAMTPPEVFSVEKAVELWVRDQRY